MSTTVMAEPHSQLDTGQSDASTKLGKRKDVKNDLKKLDLSGHGLTALPTDLDNGIEELNLSNNPLVDAELYFIKPMYRLKKLNLSGCGLKGLPPVFVRCYELEELNLSNNPLTHLGPCCIGRMHSLKKLDLSSCGLKGFSFYSLERCYKIEDLNLSSNPLIHLGLSYIGHMRSLKKLDLSGCGLKEFPCDLKIYIHLQELNLSNNFFDHQDLLDELNSGKKLTLISGKELLELKGSDIDLSSPTRIIFDDAMYTKNSGDLSWAMLCESNNSSAKSQVDVLPPEKREDDDLLVESQKEESEGELEKNDENKESGQTLDNRFDPDMTEQSSTTNDRADPRGKSLCFEKALKSSEGKEDCCTETPIHICEIRSVQMGSRMADMNAQPVYRAIVLAVHDIVNRQQTLHAVLAPFFMRRKVEKDWSVQEKNIVRNVSKPLRPGERIYFCVPLLEHNDHDHLPLKDYCLRFDPNAPSILHNNTDIDLSGKYVRFLVGNPCRDGKNHTTRGDCRAKAPIHVTESLKDNTGPSCSYKRIAHRLLVPRLMGASGKVGTGSPEILHDGESPLEHHWTMLSDTNKSSTKSKDEDVSLESQEESEDDDLPLELQEEESEGDDLPLESQEEESEGDDLPLESHDEESEDDDLPLESQEEESEGDDLPLESQEEESEDDDLPLEWQEEESEDDNLPSGSQEEESEGDDLPLESQEEESEGDDLPLESHDEESEDDDLPLESQEEESEGDDLPLESQEEESEDDDLPLESQDEESEDDDLSLEWQEEESEDDNLPSGSQEEESKDELEDNDGNEENGQTSDNSIIVDQKGGYFGLPDVCAHLLFPPNAVNKKITLKWSLVRHKECKVRLSNEEVFVSHVVKIIPEGVIFEKPVTVLLSHSLYEDQDFLYFYELIVKNLSSTGCQELKTERIRSIEDIPNEISNKGILDRYLPFAKTTIHETCALVATARIKSEHISIPTNEIYVFSKQYGNAAHLKFAFPAGVTEETQSLKIQLSPANAVLLKDIRLNKELVFGPVIRVSGEASPFLKEVAVELTYSHSDVVNIKEEFLPVSGKAIKFTTKYGWLMRSDDATESTSYLNENNNVYIERPRKDRLKFSFSVDHFSDVQPAVKTDASVSLVPQMDSLDRNSKPTYQAIVLAVHDTVSDWKPLRAVLAPRNMLAKVEKDWRVEEKTVRNINQDLRSGELIYFCVPLSRNNDYDHLPLKNDDLLRFRPDADFIVDNNTDIDLKGEYMHFLVGNPCSDGKNHTMRGDCRAKAPIHIAESLQANTNPNTEYSHEITPRSESGVSSIQEVAENDHVIPSQNEVERDPCKYFEEAIQQEFLVALGANKDAIKNPGGGGTIQVIQDIGTMTSVIISLAAAGTTALLSIPTAGISSVAGALALLTTFTVSKVVKLYKKKEAKEVNQKHEKIVDFKLKGIIIYVSKELSRIYEYHIREMKNFTQIRTLADCAVKLMLDLKSGDKFNVNTLMRKVLKDGKAKNEVLLTRSGHKWNSLSAFRKCGLLATNVETKRLTYKVKPGCEGDATKYGYRGEFLELNHLNEQEKKTLEEKAAKDEDKAQTRGRFRSNKDCTTYWYFSESDIDSEYTNIQIENRPFHPTRILIKSPKVLNSFNQSKESSLVNFLENKLNPKDEIHPVYRPHSTEKVPSLDNCKFTNLDFSFSDFSGCCLENCTFTKCVMLNTTLTGAKMRSSKFVQTSIFCSNLEDVDASFCKFAETFILYSRVDRINISNIQLFGTLSWLRSNVEEAITGDGNEVINETEV